GSLRLSIFLDEAMDKNLRISKSLVFRFIRVLEEISKKHGVVLEISNTTKSIKGRFNDNFFKEFDWSIRELESIFTNSTVLAVITEDTLTNLPIKIYDAFKRQFGGKWDISSQVITEKSLKLFQQLLRNNELENFSPDNEVLCNKVAEIVMNDRRMSYPIFNILLGIYVKSGMQPWILAER